MLGMPDEGNDKASPALGEPLFDLAGVLVHRLATATGLLAAVVPSGAEAVKR